MHRIFVYGTLKRGQPNYFRMTDPANGVAIYKGEGRTVQQWPMVVYTPYRVPFILNNPGTGNLILGDIFEVDDSMLEELDKLEGHPHLYERTHIEVQVINERENSTDEMENSIIQCETYILKDFVDAMANEVMYESYDVSVQEGYAAPVELNSACATIIDIVKKPEALKIQEQLKQS